MELSSIADHEKLPQEWITCTFTCSTGGLLAGIAASHECCALNFVPGTTFQSLIHFS